MDQVEQILNAAGRQSDNLQLGLFELRDGQNYLRGTDVPVPETTYASVGGLLVPEEVSEGPIDYAAVYLITDDYLDGSAVGMPADEMNAALVRDLTKWAPRTDLLRAISLLSSQWANTELRSAIVAAFVAGLHPDTRARLEAALSRQSDRRVFLARQPLLGAMRAILVHGADDPSVAPPSDRSPEVAAVILSHAVGSGFAKRQYDDDTPTIAGMPAELAIDLTCNITFNVEDDTFAVLHRTLRLWREYGPMAADLVDGDQPEQLLLDAAGLSIDDLVSLAFVLFTSQQQAAPGALLPIDMKPIDTALVERFLAFVSASPDELAAAMAEPRSDWDFLALQGKPIIRVPGGLIIADVPFLMERVSGGLYWAVHDFMKARSDLSRQKWTQAWGKMVEEMVKDCLRPHAPVVLGGAPTFFTEEDLKAVYGNGKRADVVIDYGDSIVALEIVSGQLSVPTRVDGNSEAFFNDMEKLAFKKLRQLDETTKNLSDAPVRLTGVEVEAIVHPVVVAAGGFPVSPISRFLIAEYCETNGLFKHARVTQPVIIDIGEVEMLEGLVEHQGASLPQVLAGWQQSGIAGVSLRNYILKHHGWNHELRPSRVRPYVDGFIEDMIHRYGLRDQSSAP